MQPVTTSTPTVSPFSRDPHPLQIEAMRQHSYPGSPITFEQTLKPGVGYDRYIISYLSDGFKNYALMTIPTGTKPDTGWPAIILNHGYISPAEYSTTERYIDYVDRIARSGYIVLKPDYRGHGSSEGGPEIGGGYGSPDYTVDVLNALSSLQAYADADPNRIGMWGHSMGGQITLRAMVVSQEIRAGVIWGGVVPPYPDIIARWDYTRNPGLFPGLVIEELSSAQSSTGNWLQGFSDWVEEFSSKYGDVSQNIQPQKTDTEESSGLTPVPDWVKTWQSSKNFEKTSAAIFVMGEMGIALRPSIIKQMAKHLSLSAANKNLDEALNWLMSLEENEFPILVEQISGVVEQGSSSGGNQPAVLHLTRNGQVAYQVLTGKIPKENEFDILIRHHSSPEHTILNIQAGEILVDEGYRIQGRAQAISLSNGETYIPDIIAVDPKIGEVIFVEVERDVSKDQISRKKKWMKFYEASNGSLYVFCDNLNCQRAIQGEINLALSGLNYNSFLTNLHGLRNGKRATKDGSIWVSQRRGSEK
ncbi:MAG: alpha/beta fold hydrolase [Anaerolineaceae bacterium]|nr:alpha/beta fold hydrolase [Anaerolineaceae bacterium]